MTSYGATLADDDVEGALFDIDGTLLDTMPGFFPSWVYACEQHGLSITIEQFYGYAGQPMPDICEDLHIQVKVRPTACPWAPAAWARAWPLSFVAIALVGSAGHACPARLR